MSTKNLLKLHEAIAIILLSRPNRTASFEEIAIEVNNRNLYKRKDDLPVPSYQILQRTTLSNGQYQHLFQKVGTNAVKLKNA